MREAATILVDAGPARLGWDSVLPRRDHNRASTPRHAGDGGDRPFIRGGIPGDSSNRAGSHHPQAEVLSVLPEILDELIAGDGGRETSRDSVVSEAGETAHGVKVKSVVSPRPGPADAGVFFEHDDVNSFFLERSGRGQT